MTSQQGGGRQPAGIRDVARLAGVSELGHSCVAFLSAPRGVVADPDRLRHFRRLVRVLGLQPVIMRSPQLTPSRGCVSIRTLNV